MGQQGKPHYSIPGDKKKRKIWLEQKPKPHYSIPGVKKNRTTGPMLEKFRTTGSMLKNPHYWVHVGKIPHYWVHVRKIPHYWVHVGKIPHYWVHVCTGSMLEKIHTTGSMLGKKPPHFVDGRCWRNPHYWINFGKFQHLVHVGTATQHLTNGNMLSKSQQCRYHQPGICSKIRFLPSLGLDLSTSKHSKLVQGLAKTIHNLNVCPMDKPRNGSVQCFGLLDFPIMIQYYIYLYRGSKCQWTFAIPVAQQLL